MEYTSNDNRKFIFKLEIKDEEKITITAQEQNKSKIIPDTYKKEFTKDELSNRKKYEITFDNLDVILQQIRMSFEKGTASFNADSSEMALSYLLFNNFKVDLAIPSYTSTPSENFDSLSAYFSHSKSFYLHYKKLLKKFASFFKQINTQIYKQDFSDLKNEIKAHFADQSEHLKNIASLQQTSKQDIISVKDILTHNLRQEISIQLQSSFSIGYQQQPYSSLPYKPIEDISKIKIINTIKEHTGDVNSVCFLKDKRLVSGSDDYSIIVYDKSYKPQIKIQNAHDGHVLSFCVLKNGELVSSSRDKKIKVWKINENDYEQTHTLIGHTGEVWKVIKLKDGKICSCSDDTTIRIWDDYKCIQTLKGHTDYVRSIIEMNNYIISCSGSSEKTLRIWDESTYQCIKTINDVYCGYWNGLSKMNDNTVLVGGNNVIYIVNIKTYNVNKIQDGSSSGNIGCFNVLKNGLILFGNQQGEICCTDSSSNSIIFRNKLHDGLITCLIESEDQLISCSYDDTINTYKEVA